MSIELVRFFNQLILLVFEVNTRINSNLYKGRARNFKLDSLSEHAGEVSLSQAVWVKAKSMNSEHFKQMCDPLDRLCLCEIDTALDIISQIKIGNHKIHCFFKAHRAELFFLGVLFIGIIIILNPILLFKKCYDPVLSRLEFRPDNLFCKVFHDNIIVKLHITADSGVVRDYFAVLFDVSKCFGHDKI